jgi:hypothetical protein
MLRVAVLVASLTTVSAIAQDSPPRVADLVARNSYTFDFSATTLRGTGADFLRRQTADSQFVLLGEDHMDHATPLFAGALFRMLHDAHGYRHLVVEQDPVAIEDALQPGVRGDAERIAALARRYPSLYEFDTDEDLTFLAQVGGLVPGSDAIWGVEQATGAVRYLEELVALAPDAVARDRAAALLAAAMAADPGPSYSVNWLAASTTTDELAQLAAVYHAPAGSRAARLLGGLAKSAEIFGYYRRAEAGEYVGLYNNTVREEVLKRNFLERYRAAATPERMPKAMFKFGANHLYHGKNPTQAFPIGNLVHEMAIANDATGFGLYVIALGDGYRSYADHPAWLQPLLPAEPPRTPTIIDLRALRPYQRLFREGVAPEQVWEQRALLHGFDVIVILPGSRAGERVLGGRT